MSILPALAPALAPVANTFTQGSGTAPRESDAGSSHSSNAKNVLASQAAIVTLSFESKGRAASSGDGRRVDASFDKQGTHALKSDSREEKKEKIDGRLNVAA